MAVVQIQAITGVDIATDIFQTYSLQWYITFSSKVKDLEQARILRLTLSVLKQKPKITSNK